MGIANTGRIHAVDALRGFAVMGIILLHNIEHFNFYSFPPKADGWLGSLDTQIWDFLFFTFSGKTYAIFALLFGLTFQIMNEKAASRGEDFKNRYMLRLVALLGFGFINALFFPGEILVLYALLGFVLVPVRNLSNRAVAWIAAVLMLQPVEWIKVAWALADPAADPKQMLWSLGDVYPQLGAQSLTEMWKANFTIGQLASLNWAWCYGRVFQTMALFMCGMLLGRLRLFAHASPEEAVRSTRFWIRAVCMALPVALLLYFFKAWIFDCVEGPFLSGTLRTILNSYYNLAFMVAMAGAFLLLYWTTGGVWWQRALVPYGRMSLTDYVMQSVVGSLIYFGYGFELHRVCGPGLSFMIGIGLLLAQMAFAHWWFRRFKRGPLETVWHHITWRAGLSRHASA